MSKKSTFKFTSLYCFFLFFTMLSVRTLTTNRNIEWTFSFITKTVLISLLAALILGGALSIVLSHFINKSSFIKPADSRTSPLYFWAYTLLIMLAWLPYYLAYFPGILAYDSYIQIGQVLGASYNNHHPLIHTLTIQACLKLGSILFGDLNAGAAIYTFLQALVLALSFAYGLVLMRKHGKKNLALITLFVIMFFPMNGYMAVSVTKDIPFSSFFLILMLSFMESMLSKESSFRIHYYDILLFFSSILAILFRNNGKYALLFSLFFILIAFIKKIKSSYKMYYFKLVAIFGLSLILGQGTIAVTNSLLKATPGDAREMLSMPIQQLARVYVYHGGLNIVESDDNSLTDDEKALLDSFFLNQCYYDYDLSISDPVKRHTNTYVPRYQSKDFIKTYISLFLRYPGEYINAFLGVNAGFLDPGDISHATINENRPLTGLGYIQTRWAPDLYDAGFSKASILPDLLQKMEEFADNNSYLKIPLFKYIFMPGIYLWIYLLFIIIKLIKKENMLLLPISFIAGYYLTCLLGPTVQLRYLYPVMVFIPFLLFIYTFNFVNDKEQPNV